MSKLNNKIKAEIPAAAIGKLYTRLSDEATPHSLRVKKVRTGVREVEIYCQITAVDYFSKIIKAL